MDDSKEIPKNTLDSRLKEDGYPGLVDGDTVGDSINELPDDLKRQLESDGVIRTSPDNDGKRSGTYDEDED